MDGHTLSVRLSVRRKLFESSQSSSFKVREQSESTQRALKSESYQSEPKILRLVFLKLMMLRVETWPKQIQIHRTLFKLCSSHSSQSQVLCPKKSKIKWQHLHREFWVDCRWPLPATSFILLVIALFYSFLSYFLSSLLLYQAVEVENILLFDRPKNNINI